MLRVKTYLDKSSIHGFGVFAAQDIKKGDIVWQFVPEIDKELEYLKYNELDKEFIDIYAYYDKQLNKAILSSDNDRFTNHSCTPNTEPDITGDVIANKDIMIDEEITINYFEIDDFAENKLKL